jgi:hypothetical protein
MSSVALSHHDSKSRRQQKKRSEPVYNIVMLEPEPVLILTSMDVDKETIESAHLVIKKTRRRMQTIPYMVFRRLALNALKEGKYQVKPWHEAKSNKYLIGGNFTVLASIDVSCGSSPESVQRVTVDICGVKFNRTLPCVIDYDVELGNWASRAIKLHTGGWIACISGACPGVFESPLPIKRDTEPDIQHCGLCNVEQCVNCKTSVEAHTGKTCMQITVEANSEMFEDPDTRKMLLAGDTQPCPVCHQLCSRIDGCNEITCSCNAKWCWACGDAITYPNAQHHFYSSNPDRCPIARNGPFSATTKLNGTEIGIAHIIASRNLAAFGSKIDPDGKHASLEIKQREEKHHSQRQPLIQPGRMIHVPNNIVPDDTDSDDSDDEPDIAMTAVQVQPEVPLQWDNEPEFAMTAVHAVPGLLPGDGLIHTTAQQQGQINQQIRNDAMIAMMLQFTDD